MRSEERRQKEGKRIDYRTSQYRLTGRPLHNFFFVLERLSSVGMGGKGGKGMRFARGIICVWSALLLPSGTQMFRWVDGKPEGTKCVYIDEN